MILNNSIQKCDMKSKMIKLVIAILMFLLLMNVFCMPMTYAEDFVGENAINDFNRDEADARIIDNTIGIMGIVLNAVKVVTAGIALALLAALSVKYMVASVEEKAEIKKHAVIYIVGAVCMFGATGIISLIQEAAKVFD